MYENYTNSLNDYIFLKTSHPKGFLSPNRNFITKKKHSNVRKKDIIQRPRSISFRLVFYKVGRKREGRNFHNTLPERSGVSKIRRLSVTGRSQTKENLQRNFYCDRKVSLELTSRTKNWTPRATDRFGRKRFEKTTRSNNIFSAQKGITVLRGGRPFSIKGGYLWGNYVH